MARELLISHSLLGTQTKHSCHTQWLHIFKRKEVSREVRSEAKASKIKETKANEEGAEELGT
jgi:hypothetical protein